MEQPRIAWCQHSSSPGTCHSRSVVQSPVSMIHYTRFGSVEFRAIRTDPA